MSESEMLEQLRMDDDRDRALAGFPVQATTFRLSEEDLKLKGTKNDDRLPNHVDVAILQFSNKIQVSSFSGQIVTGTILDILAMSHPRYP